MNSNQWIATLLFVFSLWYGVNASAFAPNSLSDPLGPGLFPIALAIMLGGVSLALFLRSSENIDWPAHSFFYRVCAVVLCLLIYSFSLEKVGFIPATALLMFALGVIFKGPWMWSLIAGVVCSLAMYALFDIILDLPLPVGGWAG